MDGGMTHVVEHLALNSNPNTAKKAKKKSEELYRMKYSIYKTEIFTL
jgi:hypothetical protein